MVILLVEDDILSRMMMEMELVTHGFEVVSSGDPMDAITKGVLLNPDLIISDWQLGAPIDGVGVAHAVKAVHPHVSVILMTGASVAELRCISDDLQPLEILSKPFDPETMTRTVETFFM